MSDTSSTQKVDHLEVDTPVPGQNYVCLSFVSPEKILQDKSKFMLQSFWTFFKENSTSENARFDLSMMTNIDDAYETFLHEKQQELEEQFHKENDFQTSVRGLKVRGAYNTMDEAKVRAKVLQRLDKSHHVFVAPVGYWLPWDPNADQVDDQVYQEDQLNELMKKYKENEVKRDIYYEEEKNKMKDQAIQENMQRKAAVESGESTEGIASALDNAAPHSDLASEFEKFKQQN